jgi:tetratricopeptide (TPR) repeat protein
VIRAVALALLLSSVCAAADPDPLSDARGHYERGMSHYELGEFTQAIDEFKIAYEASRAPGLLFNLAQASRLAKLYEQSLHFYRAYLRARPDAPNRVDAEARIAELEPLVAAQRQRELEPPATPDQPSPATPGTTTSAPPAPAELTKTPLAQWIVPRDGKRERVAGITVGVIGVAALVAAIILGSEAWSAQSKLGGVATSGGAWNASEQSLYSSGHDEAGAATALYAVGGAAAGTGAVLLIVGRRRDVKHRRMATLSAGGAGIECAF